MEIFQDEAEVFMVMNNNAIQYSLGELISKSIVMSEDEVRYYMLQLLAALNAIHKLGDMHQNINTSSILIERYQESNSIYDYHNYQLHLCTFGTLISKAAGKSATETTITMAPEVARKEEYTSKADVWSVGVICYYMLLGEYPNNDFQTLQTLDTSACKLLVARN